MPTFRIRKKSDDDGSIWMLEGETPAEALNALLERHPHDPCHVNHAQGSTYYVAALTNLGGGQHSTGPAYIVTRWDDGPPKRGRPALPPEEARVKFHAFLAPSTVQTIRAYAEANGISIGKAVDALVASCNPN